MLSVRDVDAFDLIGLFDLSAASRAGVVVVVAEVFLVVCH